MARTDSKNNNAKERWPSHKQDSARPGGILDLALVKSALGAFGKKLESFRYDTSLDRVTKLKNRRRVYGGKTLIRGGLGANSGFPSLKKGGH